METKIDYGLPLGESLLHWIKLAEIDLDFVAQIYDMEQVAIGDSLQEAGVAV